MQAENENGDTQQPQVDRNDDDQDDVDAAEPNVDDEAITDAP